MGAGPICKAVACAAAAFNVGPDSCGPLFHESLITFFVLLPLCGAAVPMLVSGCDVAVLPHRERKFRPSFLRLGEAARPIACVGYGAGKLRAPGCRSAYAAGIAALQRDVATNPRQKRGAAWPMRHDHGRTLRHTPVPRHMRTPPGGGGGLHGWQSGALLGGGVP